MTAILALGLDRRTLAALSEAGLDVEADPTVAEAGAALADRRVRAIVWPYGDPIKDATAWKLRADPAADAAAMVALLARAGFDAAEVAFLAGADDAAGIDETTDVVRHLRALGSRPPASSIALSAVVADGNNARRAAIGRLLRRGGFTVRFALDSSGIAAGIAASSDGATCVVADADLAAAAVRAGAAAAGPIWVLCAEGSALESARAASTRGRIAVHDREGAIENVLFHLNELSSAHVADGRASRRVLWSAPLRYRVAGADDGGWGMVFNLNRGGLFLRTIGAPAVGTDLWLEVRPHGASRRVHLEARVVWTKPFGSGGRPLTPPGVGLRTCGATAADQALLDEGYERLLG